MGFYFAGASASGPPASKMGLRRVPRTWRAPVRAQRSPEVLEKQLVGMMENLGRDSPNKKGR